VGILEHGIDNGTPSRHCGDPASHPKHAVTENWVTGEHLPDERSYCDGVTPLGDFVELTVRVPLAGWLKPEDGLTHEELLRDMLEEGLSTYIWDELDASSTKAVLRLRACGKDAVYPLRYNGNGLEVAHEPRHESSGS
jgi:hypothetical protein